MCQINRHIRPINMPMTSLQVPAAMAWRKRWEVVEPKEYKIVGFVLLSFGVK